MKRKKFTYLTGASGTGKSVILSNKLEELKEENNDYFVVIFSAQTSSLMTQNTVESKLKKLSREELGPLPGRKMIVMVDDINMPSVEEYGA